MQIAQAQGRSPEAAEALVQLDRALFLWHRRLLKGEIQGRLLAELGLDLELTQFHGLTAITRIQNGIGRDRGEPATIGLLAEEMNLDPSRASRIAADLIARGYVTRAAAQDDGRKSVLLLTDRAHEVLARFRELKWAKLMDIFADWSDEDVAIFSRLFGRYADGLGRVHRGESRAGPSDSA
ncbi:MarR family winged helix-turn-helix transcriptional regulator [Rubellimicrobium arenae]|uniref:MarR family winged helix-turn-helix transcriptional regulator n=1 Tax=Rubellimicrobium arenae TaxID=2817372 RepID=UPI001B318240|nr:MarR family transcriptional regulator [Rubellimicrobium arenae]